MAVKCFVAPQFLDPILTWYLSAGSVQLVSLADTKGRAPPLGAFLPSATKLWQGNMFTPVCHSVHRGVLPQGSASVHAGIHTAPLGRHPPPGQTPPGRHPPDRHTPWADTRLGRHPPPSRWLLQWTVHILLECILVFHFHAVFGKNLAKQECIPVGCILPTVIVIFPATHTPQPPCMPPTTHAPPAMHAPCHTCPPYHACPQQACPPCHTCPPATHAPPHHVCPSPNHAHFPWTEFLTHACENITLP